MTRIVEVREATIPISSQMSNAYVSFASMTASAVAVVTDVVRDGKPVVGYGFSSNGRYGQGGLLRDRFIPRLLAADPGELVTGDGANLDPGRIWQVLMRNEKPGGHGDRSVAVGVIDMAVWDAVAKIEELPLHQLLAGRYGDGVPDESVFVYAAGGYYFPGKGLDALADELRGYRDSGYTHLKLKIGGASLDDDLRRIEVAIGIAGAGDRVAVDANGRFDLRTALAYADALAPYGLFWFEEAGDPLDYALQRALSEHYDGPMATGENLFSLQDTRNLLRYAGLRPDQDWLQMDPVLGYGLVEYLRMLEQLPRHGWSPRRCMPHGGHQFALGIAAGLGLGGNESYPGVFQPFGGFADDIPIEDGRVRLPDAPGIGFELRRELMKVFAAL